MFERIKNIFKKKDGLVTIKIQVSEYFLDTVHRAKAEVESDLGQELELGEYIEGAMFDLVSMVKQAEECGYKIPRPDSQDPSYQ